MADVAPKRSIKMKMISKKNKHKVVVGLDIEPGTLAATEVRLTGTPEVTKTVIAPLDPGLFNDGEVVDPAALGAQIERIFAEHKLDKTVRLGVANQKVASRVLRMPAVEDEKERDTAIRFQAQDQIAMPLDQAIVDHQIVGRLESAEGQKQMDVMTVAARKDMLNRFIEAMKGGRINPIGIDLSAFGMIRALHHAPTTNLDGSSVAAPGEPVEGVTPTAKLYCNLGGVTNLAVARGSDCLFTRISTYGIESIAQRLSERSGLTLEHSRQWLGHVGLEKPLAEVEGDTERVQYARQALIEGAGRLADELRLSIDFYGQQEGAVPLDGIVAGGPGSTIPGLLAHLQGELVLPFTVAHPEALSDLSDADAARLTLSYGLALEV